MLSKSLVRRSDSLRVPLASFFSVLPYDLDSHLNGGLLSCLESCACASLNEYEPDPPSIKLYEPFAALFLSELRDQSMGIESRLLQDPAGKSLCAKEFATMAHAYKLHNFSSALARSMSASIMRSLSLIDNILIQPVLSTRQSDASGSAYHYVSSPVASIDSSSYLLIQPLSPSSKAIVSEQVNSLIGTLSYQVPAVKDPTYEELLQYISAQ